MKIIIKGNFTVEGFNISHFPKEFVYLELESVDIMPIRPVQWKAKSKEKKA